MVNWLFTGAMLYLVSRV